MSVKQVFNTSAELDYPTVLPTLDLDFANSKTLDPRITFTRASGGSYVGADGLIKLAGVNEARFDHDPVTGESLGFLVEESRSNLVTDSATNFNYSFNNQIIPTANDIVPDGTTVLCKHDLTGANQPFLNCRADTTLNAGTYTMSMYLKATTSFSASFAFVGETTNEIYANAENITTAWQRFTLTFTLINTQNTSRLQLFFGSQGEGKIVSVWGAQLEAGSFATTYIARSSFAQATRAADDASITGKNFSEWYRPDEYAIFSSSRTFQPNSFPAILTIDSGSPYTNSVSLFYNPSSLIGAAYWRNSGVQFGFDGTTLSSVKDINTKLCILIKSNDRVFAQNSSLQSLTTGFGFPPTGAIRLLIGAGDNPLNGTISQLSYFPKRLPNSQLQTLTS